MLFLFFLDLNRTNFVLAAFSNILLALIDITIFLRSKLFLFLCFFYIFSRIENICIISKVMNIRKFNSVIKAIDIH